MGEPLLELKHENRVWSVAFSPNGALLATVAGRSTSESGEVKVLDFRSRQVVADTYASPNGAWVGGSLIIFQGSARDGTTRLGPCAINCVNDKEPYSFHPGGVNAVFADNSVRFLEQEMDIRTFARLVTRAGNEQVEIP